VNRGAPLFPTTAKRHRVYRGLSERQERIFSWIAGAVILLFVAGWVGSIVTVRRHYQEHLREAAAAGLPPSAVPLAPTTRTMTRAILENDAPKTAYIDEAMMAFLEPLRGRSGELRFATRTPGSEVVGGAPTGSTAVFEGDRANEVSPDFVAPKQPGIYKLAVQIDKANRAMDGFNLITLVPRAEKRGGKIGLYYLGNWPWEGGGKPRAPSYAPPSGFIEVTQANQNTYISEHFRLRDFLTKDQHNVWPKYLLLDPKLVDKLELTIQELEAAGVDVKRVAVMSGFRTPRYNHSGGNVAGRANLSRHMYGDAADIYVDNDGNGNMDDINRDGRVDTRDADMMGKAAERVERKHPSLVGGIGVYSACCGHGPFTHIDVRGMRARWRGTGNG
jgi:uncharacterized protein YcbK (DUF882 family)